MKVRFSGEIEVPDGTPAEDIEAWLKFELGERCQLAAGNAMSDADISWPCCKNVSIDAMQ